MMDWTDRHCRYLHRLFAPHALLYTEMIVAAAIVRGNAARLLESDPAEHPVALQLGGCDPEELAQAARVGESAGYAEINLNVGCPSDRVKSGAFGACLMHSPSLVAECVRRMRDAVQVPVTVKCRIGIDDRDDYEFFSAFVDAVAAADVDALIVHARVAILGGLANNPELPTPELPNGRPAPARRALSPKENREIPPLKYDYVHRLKRERATLPIVINGGFVESSSIRAQLSRGLDGVMLGRAAYNRPLLLAELERAVVNPAWHIPQPWEIIERMVPYAHRQAARGVRLHSITRHMHGLMAGREGARAWRRFLSEVAARPEAVPDILFSALPILNQGLAA
ncbi:MAG: tRNA dihydrouridine(20/20a) synthase DusA [Pseudomonadota bacterium]|nr:tRNA dihydrouridine(20/20a) synthase DusA [Pseudomonadota bacterium]